jgi:hypothetical protein
MTTSRKPSAAASLAVASTVETAPDVEYFHFRIRPELVDADETMLRVAVGHSPRLTLAAGETYATPDPREARRLRRCAELEEVQS